MKPPATRNRKARAGGQGRGRDRGRDDGQGGGSRGAAEALAIAALSFLAADAERLGVFLALTGIGPEAIRAAASEPHFLAGVLDHVVGNERLLIDFAEHEGIDPFEVTRARMTLAGPQQDVP